MLIEFESVIGLDIFLKDLVFGGGWGFYVHGTDVVIWYPEGANARYRDRVGWVEDSIGGSRYKVEINRRENTNS